MSFVVRCIPFSLRGDISENWRKFRQSFDISLKASNHACDPSERKAALLLNSVGQAALELFNTFKLSDTDRNNFDKVIQAFQDFVDMEKNMVVKRFHFNKRVQGASESFADFYMDLKRLAETCAFGDQEDSILRDRIIVGISDRSLREQLLNETYLSLRQTVSLCQESEQNKRMHKGAQEPDSRKYSAIKRPSSQQQPRPSTSREILSPRPRPSTPRDVSSPRPSPSTPRDVSSPRPRPSTSPEVPRCLSDKVEACISKAYAVYPVLSREKLNAFLIHVKGKRKPKEVAKEFDKDVKGLKKQLELIIQFYLKLQAKGTKEDIKFINKLRGLVKRFEGKKS